MYFTDPHIIWLLYYDKKKIFFDVFYLFQSFLNNTKLKIFGRHGESKPGPSAKELQQPDSKQTLQFCIYTVKGYWYATVSLSTDQQNLSLFKDSYYSLKFFTPLIITSRFFSQPSFTH